VEQTCSINQPLHHHLFYTNILTLLMLYLLMHVPNSPKQCCPSPGLNAKIGKHKIQYLVHILSNPAAIRILHNTLLSLPKLIGCPISDQLCLHIKLVQYLSKWLMLGFAVGVGYGGWLCIECLQ
jgi:hypothetical protein